MNLFAGKREYAKKVLLLFSSPETQETPETPETEPAPIIAPPAQATPEGAEVTGPKRFVYPLHICQTKESVHGYLPLQQSLQKFPPPPKPPPPKPPPRPKPPPPPRPPPSKRPKARPAPTPRSPPPLLPLCSPKPRGWKWHKLSFQWFQIFFDIQTFWESALSRVESSTRHRAAARGNKVAVFIVKSRKGLAVFFLAKRIGLFFLFVANSFYRYSLQFGEKD